MKKKNILLPLLIGFFIIGCGYINQKPYGLIQKAGTPEHTPTWNYGGWIVARGSVHNHTTYSDGNLSPEELIQNARNQGIAVLAITDHREGSICIGKHQLICGNMGGVDSKKVGYEKYWEHITRLAKETTDPVILPGFEVAPHMWNEGYFPYLSIKASHWHFTTYGIDDIKVYENMPARAMMLMKPEQDPTAQPFVEFVDYITANGGMVFQAHPESFEYERYFDLVYLLAAAPVHLTDKLDNLTGVAILPEGINVVGKPGGEWDKALASYMVGIRKTPLWAWGEADFHLAPEGKLYNAATLFYLKSLDRAEVYNAMRTGRMVAISGEAFQESYVSEFSVSDAGPAQEKIMLGQTAVLSGPPVVRFSLSKEVPLSEARLIRNGKVVYSGKGCNFEFKDSEAFAKKSPVYYRVELIGEGPQEYGNTTRLITNPIFINWK